MGQTILEWFNENYIENIEQIEFQLNEMEKNHSITKEKLFEACKEIRENATEKELLYTYIELITNMCDVGIRANIAGIKLREALIDSRKEKD